jgi:hypothetical protein
MGNLTDRSILGRVLAGLVISGLTLAFIALWTGFGRNDADPPVDSILPTAVIATVLVAAFSSMARATWAGLYGPMALRCRAKLCGSTSMMSHRSSGSSSVASVLP